MPGSRKASTTPTTVDQARAIADQVVREREAGREIDIDVLCVITGFPRAKIFDAGGEWCYIPSGRSRRTHRADAVPVPYFSTDASDCAKVKAWLIRDQRLGLDIRFAFNRWRVSVFGFAKPCDRQTWAYGDTEELALARVALLVEKINGGLTIVGSEVQERRSE
jgi:hypothetical protein